MITEDDIGEMIFQNRFKDGKTTVFMLQKPPKVVLIDQCMLRVSPNRTFYVGSEGHIFIKTENAEVEYKLCVTQLQENAMTLEIVSSFWEEPPQLPEEQGAKQ